MLEEMSLGVGFKSHRQALLPVHFVSDVWIKM